LGFREIDDDDPDPGAAGVIVVVKIGTSSITDQHGEIDTTAIEKLCTEVAGLRGAHHKVVVVTSGAISAGLPALGLHGNRPPTWPPSKR
jgi:glutamate 5-kinase